MNAAAAVDMADLPMQHPRAPASAAQARARFFNSGNAFDVKLPEVPARLFAPPPQGHHGVFDCDQSRALDCGFPATTPLMLARYVRIAARDALLPLDVRATGSVWYVISGSGRLAGATDGFAFGPGDVFLLPGASGYRIEAGAEGALLWTVGNEPQLAFERAQPAPVDGATIDVVHYPAAEIERQFELMFSCATRDETSGRALIFSSDRQAAARNLTPTLTLSFNTLEPHTHQRTHRHNSAAVTLVVQGEGCHSVVGDAVCPWTPWATLVTPPGAPHSHHNAGPRGARFLIVQDGGLHYHARTMGFEFLEAIG
ncbi:quercetin dioxygenase-like cupin family protein [Variovorax sp. SG517]|uniref:cupin domain-containing protein n=1 Tax=Variovorax sp. SG517 TaxID=2587117 RepID=UPI00159E1121|nr:cupin domain-containing protein [Variovorax sp. SG517]NVM93080.1 quercetin dioxygenase-like cupin family protein [Variovorax sp. SG517]